MALSLKSTLSGATGAALGLGLGSLGLSAFSPHAATSTRAMASAMEERITAGG